MLHRNATVTLLRFLLRGTRLPIMATATTTTPRKRIGSPISSPITPASSSVHTTPSTSQPAKRVRKSSPSTGSDSLAPLATARLTVEHMEWPARVQDIERARTFLQRAATSGQPILLIPDKDADGLSAGCVVKRTLIHLGATEEQIQLHHIPAGQAPSADQSLQKYGARWIIVLDQGSVKGPALVPNAEHGWETDKADAVRCMVLDHHHVNDLDHDCPQGALLVNASHHKPVCTSALLAWCICRPLWPEGVGSASSIDYLALIGTCGDLSVNVAWDPPWPDFAPELKRWGKSKVGQVVALINAPRRTPMHDAFESWAALDASQSPSDVLDPERNPSYARLSEARRLVAAETEKQTHTPPKFSRDQRVALLTISTPYQVHPSIATRWSGTLRGAKRLEVVMCANVGFGAPYEEDEAVKKEEDGVKTEEEETKAGSQVVPADLPRYVHFSCRIANAAKQRGEDINIIALLHDYAARDPTFLTDLEAAGGGSFARGHKEASGGILAPPFWRRFVDLMQIGIKPTPPPDAGPGKSPKKSHLPVQSNKLTNYFGKK